MNNITITHELCAEDRARLDRLAEALDRRSCDQCMDSTLKAVREIADPVQQQLAETLAKASDPVEPPKNATEEAKADTAPIDHPAEEETPWPEETAGEPAEPPVTLEQIQQKVVQLAAGNNGAKKAKVREIINVHAKKVSDLPADKWAEVWKQLTALESEG